MTSTTATVPLYPRIEFPDDPRLMDLPKLFDPDWVWPACERQFGCEDLAPQQIQIRRFSHSLGRTAIVSYVAHWDPDEYVPSLHFVARLERDKDIELFQFPDDAELPGLREAADPEGALDLLNRHVLAIRAHRVRVEVIRYRPGSRAVLRHRVGRVGFYARVIRPASVRSLLDGWCIVERSEFVVPRIAGYWADGGVVWMSEIPGKNLRPQIRKGNQPDPDRLLQGLETLWSESNEQAQGATFNLSGAYRTAMRSIAHKARDSAAAASSLKQIALSLDPFVVSWSPTGIAHNDFYDDQLLGLPDGRMALVDFEEAGPGEPLLDVGNFLAHLRWASRFGRENDAENCAAYRELFRSAALDRFKWRPRELDLREAVCLFRICTNTVRQPQQDWRNKLEASLSLVNEVLE